MQALVKPLTEVAVNELWRGELGVELAQLTELQVQIETVVAKLDELGGAHAGVRLLQTIPGVGPRYQRLHAGKTSRKKTAIVAVGRKLLVRCWAMLRDQTPWQSNLNTAVATQLRDG